MWSINVHSSLSVRIEFPFSFQFILSASALMTVLGQPQVLPIARRRNEDSEVEMSLFATLHTQPISLSSAYRVGHSKAGVSDAAW